MSVIPYATIHECYQSAAGGKALEKRVSSVILNVYQIEKEDGSSPWRTMQNWMRSDGSRTKNLRRIMTCTVAEDYSRPTKRGEYQFVSGIMGISYNPFSDTEAGAAYMNFEVTELLKFWTEKVVEIDPTERERPSPGLLLEKVPDITSVPRSER